REDHAWRTGLTDPATMTDVAVVLLTHNNAATVKTVAAAAAAGLAQHFPGVSATLINADAGSSDGTPELLEAAGLPIVVAHYEPPAGERAAVPFHGVPGRGEGLRAAFAVARDLQARACVVLEADVVSVAPDWIRDLAGPILGDKADFVGPAYARHRWEGTITRLLLAPLVRALYGRRLQQPFGGQQALSARLIDHLLVHPKWNWSGRDVFRLGVRDLGGIWELILAPDTLGEVLVLETAPASAVRFPDDLWARIVYEFALGHHYAVVYREHLLRSLVPLYLGRTAAYVEATRTATAE